MNKNHTKVQKKKKFITEICFINKYKEYIY